MTRIFFLLAICFLTRITGISQQNAFLSDSLDAYIRKGMTDWQIPGLAIAIIKDGKTIMLKGYGERNLATHDKVDENTLFLIASNSKLFTATSLAKLEYEKKLSLDDRITRYFPSFTLYDSNTTKMVTIRDMLSHHLGTKTFQGDFIFWNGNLSRKEIMHKMRLLKPTGSFRQDYGYCNACFVTAGEIIPIITHQPWEVYVYDSLLVPLGMLNTHMLTTGISQRSNASHPYTTAFTGKMQELPFDQIDNLGPAGSMVSNVKDLSKWLMMQLDSGRFEGKKILPWQVLQRTRDISTAISSRKSSRYPTHFTGYGLGLFMTDYNGKQVYWHTGGAFGFVSNTCFVPEEKLGIAILTNNDNQEFFEALRCQILDAYLGVPFVNRSQQALPAHLKETTNAVRNLEGWKNRLKGNHPALPLDAYTGKYENDLYGNITIQSKDKDLQIIFNGHHNLTATLQYMDKEEWLMTYNNIAFGIFATKFQLKNNKVVSVNIRASDFVEYDPYLFIKK